MQRKLPWTTRWGRIWLTLGASLLASGLGGQQVQRPAPGMAVLHGTVVGADGRPAAGATVDLQAPGGKTSREATTDERGAFSFESVGDGDHLVATGKGGLHSEPMLVRGAGAVVLVVREGDVKGSQQGRAESSGESLEFSDQPHFSVAGVTDWTAAGGHGSDTTLRTSESLANAAVHLKEGGPATADSRRENVREEDLLAALKRAPRDFTANEALGEFYVEHLRFTDAIAPLTTGSEIKTNDPENLYALATAYEEVGALDKARAAIDKALSQHESADAYRLAATLDEKSGDPLHAVQDFEKAATLDPSERNEFEWASELLLHRAIWQAEEVFRKGAGAYPASLRMQAGLGAALFAGARYEEAASQLCKASDLDPAAVSPYTFLGEIEVASPNPLRCVTSKLARFVRLNPKSAAANYFYGMALLKDGMGTPNAKDSGVAKEYLKKAIALDPGCSEAYLQLGAMAASESDNKAAISLYLKAIEANSKSADAHYRLGVAYDRVGEHAKAAEQRVLYLRIKQEQAEDTERKRKAIKQFLFANSKAPAQ